MKTTINLRIDAEIKEELEQISLDSGLSISTLVRDLILELIESYSYSYEDNESSEVIYIDLNDFPLENDN